jgi:hypothetical protein
VDTPLVYLIDKTKWELGYIYKMPLKTYNRLIEAFMSLAEMQNGQKRQSKSHENRVDQKTFNSMLAKA